MSKPAYSCFTGFVFSRIGKEVLYSLKMFPTPTVPQFYLQVSKKDSGGFMIHMDSGEHGNVVTLKFDSSFRH